MRHLAARLGSRLEGMKNSASVLRSVAAEASLAAAILLGGALADGRRQLAPQP